MHTRTVSRLALMGLAPAVVMLACEQPATNNPTVPSAPPVNALQVVGPSAIAPGQPVQLNANVTLTDGTFKIGTPESGITWRSSNPSVAQVSQTGLVTPVGALGDAFITAQLRVGNFTRSASREVIVQPAGTFRLVGTVTEEDINSIQIADARVAVVGGSSFAITNGLGQYRLYGVPPSADIQISAGGYETRTFPLQLSENTTRSFALPLIGGRPALSGNYTVFIDATTCQTTGFPQLPTQLQHRVYEAVITQNGSDVVVKLIGGQFRTGIFNEGDHFNGQVIAGGARFSLNTYGSYYYTIYDPNQYPSVAERLSDGRYLVPWGQVTVTGTPGTGFSGAFSFAAMDLWSASFPATGTLWLASCYGTNTMTMRLVPR